MFGRYIEKIKKFKFTRYVITEILLMVIIGVFLIIAFSYGNKNGFGFDVLKRSSIVSENAEKSFTSVITQSLDDIDTININWNAGQIKVVYGEEEEISISESSAKTLDSETSLSLEVDGDTLKINWCDNQSLYIPSVVPELTEKTLLVKLPRNIDLSSILINGGQSDIIISDLIAYSNVTLLTTGNIAFDGITANKIYAVTTMGDISAEKSKSNNILCFSRDGSVNLISCIMYNARINTVLNNINMSGRFEALDVGSVNGSINTSTNIQIKDFDIHSIEGDITVKLPSDVNTEVDYKTVKGRFTSDYLSDTKKASKLVIGKLIEEQNNETVENDSEENTSDDVDGTISNDVVELKERHLQIEKNPSLKIRSTNGNIDIMSGKKAKEKVSLFGEE